MSDVGTGLTSRVRAVLVALAVTPLALVIAGAGSNLPAGVSDAPFPDTMAVAQRGAELYALNCAVCHGATGGGLAEAKLAFPEDHRDCTRCHRPSNRIVQPLSEPFVDNDMFAVGDPPALHDLEAAASSATGLDPRSAVAGRLSATAAPTALLVYVAATMPRYDPGRLTADEYAAITAHLLVLNGRVDEIGDLLGPEQDQD